MSYVLYRKLRHDFMIELNLRAQESTLGRWCTNICTIIIKLTKYLVLWQQPFAYSAKFVTVSGVFTWFGHTAAYGFLLNRSREPYKVTAGSPHFTFIPQSFFPCKC
jgi:hypothetical protein